MFGGKIIRDKLFFFGGYQGTRNRSSRRRPSTMSRSAARSPATSARWNRATCQSSGKARTLTDPITKLPFPGNQIPVSRFIRGAGLPPYLPRVRSLRPGDVRHSDDRDEDQIIGRIDYVRSSKHTLYGRYFIADYRNPGSFGIRQNILGTTGRAISSAASRSRSATPIRSAPRP